MNFRIVAAVAAVSLLASPAMAKHKPRHVQQSQQQQGFATVDAAVGVAGAAVGTAAAIATAPFGGNSDFERANRKSQNGYACDQGRMFKGTDGRMHPCQ